MLRTKETERQRRFFFSYVFRLGDVSRAIVVTSPFTLAPMIIGGTKGTHLIRIVVSVFSLAALVSIVGAQPAVAQWCSFNAQCATDNGVSAFLDSIREGMQAETLQRRFRMSQ